MRPKPNAPKKKRALAWSEVDLMRYYNDTVMGTELLYQRAILGDEVAGTALRNLAEGVIQQTGSITVDLCRRLLCKIKKANGGEPF